MIPGADEGLLTPDVRPPRAVGIGTEDGRLFCQGALLGLERGLTEFTVNFVLVGMGYELVEQCFAWVETYERLYASGMLPWQARIGRWCGRHSQPVCEWIIPDCDSKFCPQ